VYTLILFFLYNTGGTNTGVMKHVGEAVKEQQLMLGLDSDVHVVGIASWGIVDKQNALIQEKVSDYTNVLIIT